MDLKSGDCDQMLNRQNDNNIIVKQSDFSIDHILNRAGNRNNKCDNLIMNKNLLYHNYNTESNSSDESNSYPNNFTPMFSWLQYTRYRPPKLPSKVFVINEIKIFIKKF